MQSMSIDGEQKPMHTIIILCIIGLFTIVTFALAAATLGTLNKRFDTLDQQVNNMRQQMADQSTTTTTTTTTTITTTPMTADTTTPIATSAGVSYTNESTLSMTSAVAPK